MARKSLQRLCEQHEVLDLLAVCESAREVHELLAAQEVDLILLDVEMPEQSGFELLAQLAFVPQVVLITSKTEYAFDAFQYQVTDYLQKPITPPRFKLAIEKVLDLHRRKNAVQRPSGTKSTSN